MFLQSSAISADTQVSADSRNAPHDSLLPTCEALLFHGEVRGGEWYGSEIRGLATVVRFFVAMRNLLGDSWPVAVASASGGDNTWEVQTPTLQGENPEYGLN
jgi:hypothetical protein